jgi:hypothetical protein
MARKLATFGKYVCGSDGQVERKLGRDVAICQPTDAVRAK